MEIKNNLELNQSQRVTINLQMQKSLQILQLSYPEMIEKINKELEKNPLLEPESKKEEKNLYNSKLYLKSKEDNSKSKYIENTLEQKKNLREHVNEQINIDINNNDEKLIAQKFLEYIDSNGYIKDNDVNKIFEKLQAQNFNITLALIERTLKKIQEFDPPGIFARNLSECIEIQLKLKKLFNSKYHFLVRNLELLARNDINTLSKKTRIKKNELIRMIKNIKTLKKIQDFDPPGIFARNLSECIEIQLKSKKLFNSKYHFLVRNLELLAKNDIGILCKKTRLKKEELLKMIKNIKSLNPKPASIYDHQPNVNIIPDIILKQNKDNFKLELNKSEIPKFDFNKKLYQIIKKKKLLHREKENLSNWVKSGKLLLNAIKNRGITLEKVTKEIIKHQNNFFKKGINYFYPLTQKEIAEKTGFHESTISRCITNKYIQTPKGVYELKYFFSRGINSKDKVKLLSNNLIKNKILRLIKDENNKDIMSDKHIVFKLKKKRD